MLGHVAQLQVPALLPNASQTSDYRSQTTAVNEDDLAKVQDNGSAIMQQPCNVGVQ